MHPAILEKFPEIKDNVPQKEAIFNTEGPMLLIAGPGSGKTFVLVLRTLNILLNNKILIKEKRFLNLNFENKNLKIILDIIKKEHIRFKEIPLKVYYIILEISSVLSKIKNITKAYLFGSYAKLIYTERSDIDLAIILEKEDKNLVKKFKKDINKIEEKYNKNVELHFFEKKDMKQKDPIIREILKNNIDLFSKD